MRGCGVGAGSDDGERGRVVALLDEQPLQQTGHLALATALQPRGAHVLEDLVGGVCGATQQVDFRLVLNHA